MMRRNFWQYWKMRLISCFGSLFSRTIFYINGPDNLPAPLSKKEEEEAAAAEEEPEETELSILKEIRDSLKKD